jgi:hypothetical protein
MIRVALSISIFFILSQVCYGQDQSPKYYCPPCNCIHDGKLFDKPGVCPDPQCGMQLLPVQGNYSESKLKYIVTFLRNNWLIRLYDILILPAIIQGFILSLILIFRGHANRHASVFLAVLIIALSFQNIKFYYILHVLVDYITNTGGNPEYNIESLAFPL